MLYPLMLAGLLGLAGPIIIHLIHRQKLQPKMLATLKFLDPGEAANAFEPVPRDILQLILRLLLLLMFIILMVRFTAPSGDTGTRALAIVIDQSMSTQRRLDDNTILFNRQREQVAELINDMRPGDRFSLMLVGDDITVDTGFLRDKDALNAMLETFEPSEGGSRGLAPAISRAIRQLQSRKEVNVGVMVFSDHQRATYDLIDNGHFSDLLSRGRVQLYLIGDTITNVNNVAISDARFTPERVYLGTSSKVTATIENFTDEEQQVEVFFMEGENSGEARALKLEPRETARIDLVHSFESPIDAATSVHIADDALPADNVFHLPMRMRQERQILLVSERREADHGVYRASHAGHDLLAYAINPGEVLPMASSTFITVRRVTPNLLGRQALPLYSTIIVYGLSQLPEQSIDDLLAYAKNGGAVVLIPTSETSPSQFNESFAKILGGFHLGGLKEPEAVVNIDRNEASVTHPILQPMLRGEWGGIEEIYFSRYFDTMTAGAMRIALQATNGDVLAALGRLERGHVYVQTFGLEVDDTSLTRSIPFVPKVQHLLDNLGVQGLPVDVDMLRVNDNARMQFPELRGQAGMIEFTGPELQKFELQAGQQTAVKLENMKRAGNYRATHQGLRRPRWLSVNPVEGQSDLAILSPAEQERIFGTENVHRLSYSEVAAQFARRTEIFSIILILLFLAFIVEAVFGATQSLRGGGDQ